MILNIQDARDTLRVDGDENDDIIEPILVAIPSELEVRTGRDWTKDNDVHPLAQQSARFILQLYFNPHDQDSERLKRTIDSLLGALEVIGRSYNE